VPDPRCRHANCACAVEPEGPGYCGEYCAGADRSDELPAACACGHRPCDESQRHEPEGDEKPRKSVARG